MTRSEGEMLWWHMDVVCYELPCDIIQWYSLCGPPLAVSSFTALPVIVCEPRSGFMWTQRTASTQRTVSSPTHSVFAVEASS